MNKAPKRCQQQVLFCWGLNSTLTCIFGHVQERMSLCFGSLYLVPLLGKLRYDSLTAFMYTVCMHIYGFVWVTVRVFPFGNEKMIGLMGVGPQCRSLGHLELPYTHSSMFFVFTCNGQIYMMCIYNIHNESFPAVRGTVAQTLFLWRRQVHLTISKPYIANHCFAPHDILMQICEINYVILQQARVVLSFPR